MSYTKYLTYSELVARLEELIAAYPTLATLSSAGKSYEGRDIWAVTVTNSATGPASAKPALYAEGNIHAGEVTASMTCLYLLEYLCQNYDKCPEVTHLLNTKTFYLLPRVNPDGAEKYLTSPYLLRSSVRPYPGPEVAELPGLHPSDINGDDRILQMRVRDDKRGEWKVSTKDDRLLVRRTPSERGGQYYRIYPEGLVKDVDTPEFDVIRPQWGLDLNRNFPSNWDRSFEPGGTYPTSEPEIKTVVDFILAHPNIGGLQSFHTSGGFFFRNPYQYGEDKMDQEDLRAMKEIAREGTKVTGYPDVKSNNRSTLPEWAYEHLGLIGYTTELWDRLGHAGLSSVESMKNTDPEKWEETQLRLLQWNDQELCGEGFFAWQPFLHPQLGPVEIGGWDPKFALQNPPPHLLKQECHKNSLWAIKHAETLPELEISDHKVTVISDGIYKVQVSVQNVGYLPTHITNKGKQVARLEQDQLSIITPEATVLSGERNIKIGFLQGYLNSATGPAKSSATVTWLIQTNSPEITVELKSQRGGNLQRSILVNNSQF